MFNQATACPFPKTLFPCFPRIFSEFSGPSFFFSSFLPYFFPARSLPLQERLLGLQGGGTGAGGGDTEEMMLASLAPEGTREWHDRRSGLPAGATKSVVAGQYEQVGGVAYGWFSSYQVQWAGLDSYHSGAFGH